MIKEKGNTFVDNILKNKKIKIVSTAEALKDVHPINWSDSVRSGKIKVILSK